MLQSKRLEIDFSQKAAVLGEIAWLYSQTEATRSQPFSDLAELAEGPLRCGQYRIYRKANVPVGFVAWAQLSEIAEKKVALNSYRLTHDMWNSGNRIWLTTIISNSVKHSDVVEKTKLIFDKKYQFKGQITDLRNENLRQLVLKSANTRKLVQIRRAETLNDINLLFPLGKIASEEPSFNLSNFDLNKRKKVYEEWLENKKKYVILIAEQEGEAIGFLTAWAGRHYLSKTDVAATVTAFFVLPEKRGGFAALKLIDGFRQWAKNRDAKSIHIHVTSGIRIRETDRFLRKIGFRSMGGNYAKDL